MVFRPASAAILLILLSSPSLSQGFEEAKYGGDFLSVGSGARPLGMGGAFTSVTNDVLSGYWNPAGLTGVDNWQFAYMHSERFAGVVGYDYGAVAVPVQGSGGVVALSFFRQGVDGIKNTLHAWDPEQNRPRSDPESYMTEFSASDISLFLSYANSFSDRWHWGVTAKALHSRLGPFANAWGYSLDAGIQLRGDRYRFGVNLQNITTLMKFWNVNQSELEGLESFINPQTGKPETLPEGTNEYVKPSVKIGGSRLFDFGDITLLTAIDTDILFEGRRTYYLNVGDVSFEPHAGAELGYKDLIFLRAGVTDIHFDDRNNLYIAPTLGAGFRVGAFMFDYGFSSFAGMTSDLGFTHRISLQVML
ncbi:PorV/PorQ family protein [Balneolales bacterium ANBcel1]|nr:PorV/PorQ family protein [Balneolales bacterium ANBcel1]